MGKYWKIMLYKIILETNEEMIAGSTRLKAGTSQKICLNLISSMLMIKLGKVKKGRMISLVANNKKLKLLEKKVFFNTYEKNINYWFSWLYWIFILPNYCLMRK